VLLRTEYSAETFGSILASAFTGKWFWLLCGVLSLLVVSCGKPDISRFQSGETKKISSHVWLHRTSRHAVMVTDKDGMGLVFGNVTQIGYDQKDRTQLIVGYSPADSARTNDTDSSTKLARIDLKTGNVTKISDADGAAARSLKHIDSFFP
jgi:hypothetical protein